MGWLSLFAVTSQSLAADEDKPVAPTSTESTATKSEPIIMAPEIEVKARRMRIISPLPGVGVDRDQASTNIQSATAKEIAASKAINLTEFMNGQMQSVSVNDYAGNPFQQDLNFRGFTASPLMGTPQGISVYLDGVRINEAFGDVVNWDMIPMNALGSLNLLPGSSPLFGLNTLGGALALRTKTGFTDTHARAEMLTGAWGREQLQASNGYNDGTFGIFTAINTFKEDGWRDKSPTRVNQIFNNATLRGSRGEINLSLLAADNKLTGNGMLPIEQYEERPEGIFTGPDYSKNEMTHWNLNGRFDITDNMSLSILQYGRRVSQEASSGDFYDEFYQLVNSQSAECANGMADGALSGGGNGLGCPGLTANGVINSSELKQRTIGRAIQLSFETDKHQITAGISYDKNHVDFMQSQLLAGINADREVIANPDYFYDENYQYFDPDTGYSNYLPAAKYPVIRNKLKGGSTTKGVFFSDTWSPLDNLHITYGARYNYARVMTDLQSDRGLGLYNFTGDKLFNPFFQRCATNPILDPLARFICTSGDYKYRSFNPSFGVAWEPIESLSLYGNLSRGARVPTAIELGCAVDHDLVVTSTNFQYGCSIPTSLTADPYLKQVRSTAYETGMRGVLAGFDWNVGVFRTELQNDILFIPLGRKNRGVFDNFGETLRQGIEAGMSGRIGRHSLRMNYTYLRATFESPATINNPNNSSHVVEGSAAQTLVHISPGDSLPGMPNHIFQAAWNYAANDRFDVTLSMVMHSFSFVRGNENNKHEPREATATSCPSGLCDRYDYIGPGKTPGYAIFNLRANYKLDYGFTLFTKMDNIFDRDYLTAGDLGRTPFTPGPAAHDAAGFNYNSNQWKNTTFVGPGAPRAIWVGLTYDFDWRKKKE